MQNEVSDQLIGGRIICVRMEIVAILKNFAVFLGLNLLCIQKVAATVSFLETYVCIVFVTEVLLR